MELFNLADDEAEARDLSRQRPQLVRQMQSRLVELSRSRYERAFEAPDEKTCLTWGRQLTAAWGGFAVE